MSCADDSYFDLMHVNGPQIGKVKLSFEADDDAGVAIKLKKRDDDSWSWQINEALGQNMIEALGEFESDDKSVLNVPADEQLIGFYGTQDENDQILSLGLVTMSNECATESVDPATGVVNIGDSGAEELSLAEIERRGGVEISQEA